MRPAPFTTFQFATGWRRILYLANYGADKLGVPGVIGLGLLCFGLVFASTTLLDGYRHSALVDSAIDFAQTEGPADTPGAQDWRRAEVDAYNAILPEKSRLPSLLGQLHDAAQAHGLRLRSSDFQAPASSSSLTQPAVVVTLEFDGSHEKTIHLVNTIFEKIPSAALEGLSMTRATLSDPTFATQIRLRVFLGNHGE